MNTCPFLFVHACVHCLRVYVCVWVGVCVSVRMKLEVVYANIVIQAYVFAEKLKTSLSNAAE